MKFFNVIADIYNEQGFDYTVVNSNRALIKGLIKDKRWIMTNYTSSNKLTYGKNANRNMYEMNDRMKASFIRPRYKNGKDGKTDNSNIAR